MVQNRTLQPISPPIFTEVTEALSHNNAKHTLSYIMTYTGRSKRYVEQTLCVGMELNCIEKTADTYTLKVPYSPGNYVQIVLSKYDPFCKYCAFVSDGNLGITAARKVKALFGFESSEKMLNSFFINWGRTALFLKVDKDNAVSLLVEIKKDIILKEFDSADEISSRNFVIDWLGKHVNVLSDQERTLITQALLKCKSDPRNSVNDAGQAFEDFLRDTARKFSIDVTKKNGIIEISNEIKNKSPNLFSSKHFDITIAIGSMRNMAGHSQDKISGKHWQISDEFARLFCLITLKTTYSILEYLTGNQAI